MKTLRSSLKHHVNNICQYRQFKCEHCGYQSTYLVITTEHYDQCSKYPLYCPNNCSTLTYPRDQLDLHLGLCPEQIVDCAFSEMGCRERMKRRLLQQHLESNMLQHQMIMCTKIKGLQKDNKELQKDNKELQKDKQDLEKQVGVLTRKSEILLTIVKEAFVFI